MAIKIPADAAVIQDSRITKLCVISGLYKAAVESDGGLREKIKQTMRDKGVAFAQSDFAVAQLRGGDSKKSIPAKRLYRLVQDGRITLAQFVDCVSVVKARVEELLAPPQVESLLEEIPGGGGPALFAELKANLSLNYPALAEFIGQHAVGLLTAA